MKSSINKLRGKIDDEKLDMFRQKLEEIRTIKDEAMKRYNARRLVNAHIDDLLELVTLSKKILDSMIVSQPNQTK